MQKLPDPVERRNVAIGFHNLSYSRKRILYAMLVSWPGIHRQALVEGESCINAKNKGVQNYQEHGEAEPCECPEIIPDDKAAQVFEGLQINFLDE